MKIFKVMFVCLGNICRSPAAQAVLEHRLGSGDLRDRVIVESSGTDAYHTGEQSDSRMRRTAASHGVAIDHRSRRLTRGDISGYDLILTMDSSNQRTVLSMCQTDEERSRVRQYRDFDPVGPGDVPDPWYGGSEGFETVWDILERTTDGIIDFIRSRLDD